MSYKLRILSLGAGVQSTTLYLMAERGEIEPFSCAIFADTGWEGEATYRHLAWLQQIGKTPIITVRASMSIFDHSMMANFRRTSVDICGISIPAYISTDGTRQGISKRQCTQNFKLEPIRREVRRLLGLLPRQRATKDAVEQCIGISVDEARRMRLSRDRMTVMAYPLIDKGMSRWDCQNWLSRNYGGLVVPKSSCIGCPFHSNNEWRSVSQNVKEWKQAVELDKRIREISGFRGNLFLHRSCRPLDEVDLSTPEERGQTVLELFQKTEKLYTFAGIEI